MAETVCRTLRDGCSEGEHAPTLTIKASTHAPFGRHVFSHVLAQLSSFILAGKSQSKGLVLVAISQSPAYYLKLLESRGLDVVSAHKWIRILDCYTDPLGWKEHILGSGRFEDSSKRVSSFVSHFTDVRDLDKLLGSVIELGKGLVGQGKEDRFSVALDSIDVLLRHSSVSSLAGLISNLRGHEQASCVFCLLHPDLHEVRITSVLDYISSMVASIEPSHQSEKGQKGNAGNASMLEHNFGKGKLHARLKRRNGRVKVMYEEFTVEQSGIKFAPVSSVKRMVNQGLLPKVQFNLELSEKEKSDRAKVVLPFEHQGNGEPIQIYDGRRSLPENKEKEESVSTGKSQWDKDSKKGEIIYFRDSDDEMPDSDEDPDDDLDI